MLDRLIQWSLAQRLVVVIAAATLFAWGAWHASSMPVDVFPDLAAPTVTVIVEAHGMAPEEVESQVTLPVETALNAAPGVRRVRSATGIGSSLVFVEFDWETDVYLARQVVSESLQLVRSELPPGVDPPTMGPISSVMGEIMFVALSSTKHSPIDVRTEADWLVRQRIASIPGISQVVPMGGGVKQYKVIVSPEKLAAHGIGLNEVLQALQSGNENVSAGFFEEQGREYLIYGLGRITRDSDIGETLLRLRNGHPIRIADVAHVEIGPAFTRGAASLNGEDAVIIAIQKQPDANTLELTRNLDQVFDGIERALPDGMELHRDIFRQADFIEIAVQNVLRALRDGSLLVIFIILLFLANAQATAITATIIPLSLLVSVLVLSYFGGSINTMTLGGMAIAVGVLVDDAIVVVENILRRLHLNADAPPESRRPSQKILFEATQEMVTPLVYANLTVFLVFLPLLFLSGVEGRLLQPLGVAFIVSVRSSLLIALTVTPALSSYLLPRQERQQPGGDSLLVRWLKAAYEPILQATLPRWKSVAALSLVATLIAAAALSQTGRSFLPPFNEGTLTIAASTLPGTSLQTSHSLGRWVEEVLHTHPEVITTARRTGRAERDEHAQEVNASELEVTLQMQDRSKDELLAALREDLGQIPGVNIAIDQPISHRIDHMLSGTRANIAVKLFGEDLYELRRLAQNIEAAIADVPGVVDLNVEQQTDIPFLLIDLDRAAIARHGLTVSDLTDTLEIAFIGHQAGLILEGQRSFDLLVRLSDQAQENVEAIRQTLITTPLGAQIPLHALADIRRDRRPNRISRENARRLIVVSCNVAGADLVGVVNEIERRIAAQVDFPDGYYVEFGGQFESANQASRILTLLTILAILGVFLLLYLALNSGRDATLVMVNLPLALIGGVAGIFFLDGIISVASLIGFITLFGIATRNGLLLISHIRHLHLHEGVADLRDAVRQGSLERLSPILMTALASGLGLMPLALQAGQPGGEIQAPMAVVILSGLITSTILNMIVIPALYLRFGDLARTK